MQWYWTDLDHSSRFDVPMGSLVNQGRPYVYLRDTTGRMHHAESDGSNWWWTDHGSPPGATLADRVGATTIADDVHVFVRTADGDLWVNAWNNGGFFWYRHGRPVPDIGVKSGAGAVTRAGKTAYTAFIGTDGVLRGVWFDGVTWAWFDRKSDGVPPLATGVGTMLIGDRPYTWVIDVDGRLRCNYFSDGRWIWYDHGTPGNTTVAAPVGVTTYEGRACVMVVGQNGALYACIWEGAEWYWYSVVQFIFYKPGRTPCGAMVVGGVTSAFFVATDDTPHFLQITYNHHDRARFYRLEPRDGSLIDRGAGNLTIRDHPWVFALSNGGLRVLRWTIDP
jgi:hypothetical protein